jgi:hypothetical protein
MKRDDDEAEFKRLQRWDAEIEADFQRAVAKTKSAGRAKRGRRLIGAPMAFVADVCRLTDGRAALVVALLIYRRTHVCKSQTVTLPGEELTAVGINRKRKSEALMKLEAAGFVRLKKTVGRSIRATLLWQRK